MANKSLAIIAAISVIGLLFLVYLAATFENPQDGSSIELERPVPRPVEPIERAPAPVQSVPEEPAPVSGSEVITEMPVAPDPVEPEAVEPMVELPSLNDSDEFLLTRLAALETGQSLMRVLASDDLIRKFVVFTENAAEGNLPQLDYPVQRLEQEMQVQELDNNLFQMDPASYQRFDEAIDAFVSVDVQQGVALLRLISPLLQNAYAEIGYRDRSFEPTVIAAIDTVLNARTVEGPFQLVKPSVMYLYAEQEIEDMSPIEKQLIRMGPENAARLKERLAEYRDYLQSSR